MALPLVYNLESVRARWRTTIVAILGIAGTVGVFVAMLALAKGFQAALMTSGDPDNAFEWVGVLREIFGVSDALLAVERKREGGAQGGFNWADPEVHPEPLRGALAVLRPFILKAQDEGVSLERFCAELVKATRLEEKIRLVDPSGGVAGELERLLAQAAERGWEGAGPRDWWRDR